MIVVGVRRDRSSSHSVMACAPSSTGTASPSSSGITVAERQQGDDGSTVIATWHPSADSVDFQPVSAYPEPGLLRWHDDGSLMTEAAPSGAYVEQWRLMPGSRSVLQHHVVGTSPRVSLYVAGEWAMYVRDRVVSHDAAVPLVQQVREAPRALAEQLVDCEFSFARRADDGYVVEHSTLPWREGSLLHIGPQVVA